MPDKTSLSGISPPLPSPTAPLLPCSHWKCDINDSSRRREGSPRLENLHKTLFLLPDLGKVLAAMAAISSVSVAALRQASERKSPLFSTSSSSPYRLTGIRLTTSSSSSKSIVCRAAAPSGAPPTVYETKYNFLNLYKRPIPSIYNNILQELLVQQHLMRYKKTYQYDAVFALGFVTVFEQLMEGYPSSEDRDAIFRAYVEALREDPEQYRNDAQKLEEWAQLQNANSLIDFSSRDGDAENILKDIARRARGAGNFSYSRFIAIGLFRLLELANATEPSALEKLCAALNINKRSVDRDLDVYRNLLSKLVQSRELLKEYVDREKKKREERSESQKANEAITKCIGDYPYARKSLLQELELWQLIP